MGDRPIRLLQAVDGLDYVPMPGADQCCGFGGTFAVKNAEVSSAMLQDTRTYEHVQPATVGNARKILVSEQAGRSNVLAELGRLGPTRY